MEFQLDTGHSAPRWSLVSAKPPETNLWGPSGVPTVEGRIWGRANRAVCTLKGDVSGADEGGPLHQGVRPLRGPQGLPHTPESGPDTFGNVLLSSLPATATAALAKLRDWPQSSPPPSQGLGSFFFLFFSFQSGLCDSWGQEPACSCDYS